MICPNCRQETSDNNKFCTHCGAPLAQSGAAAMPKKKGGKKKFAVIAVIAALVCVIGGGYALAAPYINNLVSSMVMSPEDYYYKLEKKSIDEMMNAFDDMQSNASDASAGSHTSVEITVGDKMLELAEVDVDEVNEYLGNVRTVGLDLDINADDSLWGAKTTLTLEGTDITDADFVLDTDDEKLYIGAPDLLNKYLEQDIDGVEIPTYDECISTYKDAIPSSDTMREIADSALKAGLENVSDVEKGKDDLTVGDNTYRCTTVEMTLDAQTLKAVLEEIRDDGRLGDIIGGGMSEMLRYTILGAYVWLNPDVDVDFNDALDELIEELEYAGDGEVNYTVYISSKGEILGRVFEIDDADVKISFLPAKKGSSFDFEWSISGETEASVTGSGTLGKSGFTGEIDVDVMHNNVLTIELDSFKKNSDGLTAAGKISAGSDVSALLGMLDDDYEIIGDILKNSYIQFDITSSKSESAFNIDVVSDGDSLIALDVKSAKDTDYVPEVPNSVCDIDDADDAFNESGLSDIIDRLESAGIPEDTLSMLSLMTGL